MAVLSLLLVNPQPWVCKSRVLLLGALMPPLGGSRLSLPWGPSKGLTVGMIESGPWQELVPTQLVSKMSGYRGQERTLGGVG